MQARWPGVIQHLIRARYEERQGRSGAGMAGATVESIWQSLKAQSLPRSAGSYSAPETASGLAASSLPVSAVEEQTSRSSPTSSLNGLLGALTAPAANRRKAALQQLQVRRERLKR